MLVVYVNRMMMVGDKTGIGSKDTRSVGEIFHRHTVLWSVIYNRMSGYECYRVELPRYG